MKKLLFTFVIAFITLPMLVMGQCGSNLTATDQDGATYQSLKIGPHCWMQTNLKTNVPGSLIYSSDMYPDTTANLATFGRLYPWAVATDPNTVGAHNFVKGVCPEGWHIPLPVEVQQLSANRASDVHSAEQWLTPGTNTTGFGLLPGGFYNSGTLRCENLGGEAYFWSVGSNNEPIEVWSDCHCEMFLLNPGKENNALSVRCVYKIYQAQVATNSATNIKAYQADLNGNVIFAGYDENFKRGFQYGTDANNLSLDTVQIGLSDEGTYTYTVKNLLPNTKYYYRAYVINEFDTEYGPIVSFTTPEMTVTTDSVVAITRHSADLYGNVTSMGGYTPENAGFLWGTDGNNLTDTAKYATDIIATGAYHCALSDLTQDTRYFYCAYVTNGEEVEYGDTLEFNTAFVEVSTLDASNVTSLSATLNGKLNALKVYNSTKVGFRYGQHKDYMVFYAEEKPMTSTGTFAIDLSNISPNTTYYFQAYAHNETDTAWAADTLSFRTLTVPCLGAVRTNERGTANAIDSVLDHEGNRYLTVQIGNQCWMAENMRATTEPDNPSVSILKTSGNSPSAFYAYNYNNSIDSAAKYGCLYNWPAAMNGASNEGARGICPEGWHVPANAEWTELVTYANVGIGSGTGSGKLAGSCDWLGTGNSTTPNTYTYADRNSTGFSALPAGAFNSGNGVFQQIGDLSYVWTSTADSIYVKRLYLYEEYVNLSSGGKAYGFSVRCLRDPEVQTVTDTIAFLPNGAMGTMDTMFVTRGDTALNANTFSHSGNWQFLGWNTEADGSGTAYANQASLTTNGNLTLYAQWHTWCTGTPKTSVNEFGSSRIDSVKDVDNNKYTVVQIGNQCWMKQNLRTITNTADTGNIYTPITGGYDVGTYGRLYDWAAVMQGESSTKYPDSGNVVQGICPTGWHVPSSNEWDTLSYCVYNSAEPDYKCGNDCGESWIQSTKCIAKALAATTGWNSSDGTCRVGDSLSSNNATGFSMLPAGCYQSGSSPHFSFCKSALVWSATAGSADSNASTRGMSNSSPQLGFANSTIRTHGCSVRCVRDEEIIDK